MSAGTALPGFDLEHVYEDPDFFCRCCGEPCGLTGGCPECHEHKRAERNRLRVDRDYELTELERADYACPDAALPDVWDPPEF